MSPGFPYEFYPKVSDEADGKYPHVAIAGDGSYAAHILTRTGELQYDRDTITDQNGTVGALAWADLDGDGY